MKIAELRLERFGHFAGATLPFCERGLSVVYGANEAGKSTLLAALRSVLFGMPRGGVWDFRFPAETLALAGRLVFGDGSVAELRRDKKQLWGKLAGDALSDELLRTRLGRPSAEMFATVFAFSLDDLQRGGETLRDEGLRAAIAGAGLGAKKSPQAIIAELKQEAEALFTKKGKSGKRINALHAEIKDRDRALRAALLRSDDYRGRVAERDAAAAEAARLGEERAALGQQIADKEALLRALPRRDELRGALAERAALGEVTLPPTARAELEQALQARAAAAERVAELDAKLVRATTERDALVVDRAVADAKTRIRRLAAELGRHREESRQASELATDLLVRRRELAGKLAELRPGLTLAALDLLPHPLFTTGLERLRDGFGAQREHQAEIDRLRATQRELDGRRQALRRRLDPPWPWSGEADATSFLPVPRAEECRRQRALGRELDARLGELVRDDERLQKEARAVEDERARLDSDAPVPSQEELARLRETRDLALQALRRALAGARAGAAERMRAADELERAIRGADAHADELRRRADDVSKKRELDLRAGELARARAERAEEIVAARETQARAEAAWRALWERCGFLPQSPDAMLEWLEDYGRLRELDGERERIAERLALLTSAREQFLARLLPMLQALELDGAGELAAQKRVVDTVLQVRVALEELRRDEARAAELERSVAALAGEVERLVAQLAPESHKQPPAEAVEALVERLDRQERVAERRRHLGAAIDELEGERRRSRERERAAGRALTELRRRAGVDSDDAFLVVARAAERAHALDREIAESRRALAEARGAVAADAFERALDAADQGRVAAELEDLGARLAEVERAYADANQRLGAAKDALHKLDGGACIGELSVDIESRRAELGGLVEEYATVTLARLFLERQVARFQEQHQPRMLEDLSSLFAALTEGRYRRVYPQLGPSAGAKRGGSSLDEGTFVAVRADGVEVTPAAMSTGTREQLFFAVRLAYVQKYCAAAEPLPLVLDDVLVNFDAARARATLAVLADFAARTQVILLTCHPHIVELARGVAGAEPIAIPSA